MRLAALEPFWHRGRSWWSERVVREQILIGGLCAVLIFAALLILVIRPMQDVRAGALADIRAADMISARAEVAGPLLTSGAKVRRGTPSTIVTQSAVAAGLSVQRIEPEGNRLRVVLADAPFETVIRWTADLEATSALRVGEARIERTDTPGMVSAQFLLASR